MKKKSVVLLMILTLSMFININRVEASVTAYDEQWENECKYNGGEGALTLYIKSGKSLIIKQDPLHSDALVIYNGESKQNFGKGTKTRKYKLKNKILVNDGKCPVMVYEKKRSNVGTWWTSIYYTYTLSDPNVWGTEVYFLEGGSSSPSSKDNNGYTNCGGIIDTTTKEIINKYLGYVHIIVPIMILALGVYDFLRAMIASKEDEMKKAQKRFIIRLVAGVLVFLAPTIVNLIIDILNSSVTNREACKLLGFVQNNAHL